MYFLVLLSALLACAAGVPVKSTKPKLDGHIVGGTPTDIIRHPYQVSLQYSGSHICSGAIISSNWVVTAAHCITGTGVESLSVKSGSTYSDFGGTNHKAVRIIVHEYYDINTTDFDVALVQVSPAFTFGSAAQPIALGSKTVRVGTDVVVTGWGTTSDVGIYRVSLHKVTVQIISDSTCNSVYAAFGGITPRMICAGVSDGGRDACQGDSGGPMVANNRLVGIVSWGLGCDVENSPGVYTRVSAVHNWITTNTECPHAIHQPTTASYNF